MALHSRHHNNSPAAGLPALHGRSYGPKPQLLPLSVRRATQSNRRSSALIHKRASFTVVATAGTLQADRSAPLLHPSAAETEGLLRPYNSIRSFDQEKPSFLEAQLRLLVNAASDRAEMHAILAQQRDNWNKLFQGTLTVASLSACLLAALTAGAGAGSSAPSLGVPALLLNAGCATVMSVVNHFQPSHLAEEQRSATRQYRRLVNDVEGALQTPPSLRQHTPALLRESQHGLRALDAAFPMPLSPGGGLDKFPNEVIPPALLNVADSPDRPVDTPVPQLFAEDATACNGWNGRISQHLQRVALETRKSDTDMYVGWAQNVAKVNKCLAITAPLLAASAAALNAVGLLNVNVGTWPGTLAALCSLTSAFVGSISHDLQLGTVFEMYRNAAGHYAEVEQSIHNALQTHPSQREHGLLFLHRVNYKLGRWDDAITNEPHHE